MSDYWAFRYLVVNLIALDNAGIVQLIVPIWVQAKGCASWDTVKITWQSFIWDTL